MDQVKTGELIRLLRQKQGLTQLALAGQIGVSDKAVSKWERGCGAPDIALLPALSAALKVDTAALLKGDLDVNARSNGNLKKLRCYVCPDCGNILFATDTAGISCCGHQLTALKPARPDDAHRLNITVSYGEWYLTSAHEMTREHAVSFVAFVNGDTLTVKKLYPEWGLEVRLPFLAHGSLLWYCNRHGLFEQGV